MLATLWLLFVALPVGLAFEEWALVWPSLGMLLVGVPLYLLLGPDEGREH